MRKRSFLFNRLILATTLCLGLASGGSAEILGKLGIGQDTVFELDANAKLLEHTDGATYRWAVPTQESKVVSISFGILPSGKPAAYDDEPSERMLPTPFVYDAQSRLYRGDWETRTWELVGNLPEEMGLVKGVDHLAVDPHSPGRMYWVGTNTIWASADAGKSWAALKTIAEPVERLVLAIDGTLYAFTRFRATYGPIEAGENGLAWPVNEVEFTEGPVKQTVLLASNEILLVPEHGDLVKGNLTARSSSGTTAWRRLPDGELRSLPELLSREYTVQNATTRGCRYDVFRFASGRGWVLDNYWDFNHEGIRVRLTIQLKRGSNPNCVWSAPFSSPYWRFEGFWGNRVTGGYPGETYLHVYANPRSHAFIRAIAVHVENSGTYRSCLPAQGTNDSWAIVVQNSRNGGTACQALAATPTSAEANRAGRTFLGIQIFGSNPGCAQTRFGAIACVSERGSSGRRCSAKTEVSSGFALAFPKASVGMGECILPDVD